MARTWTPPSQESAEASPEIRGRSNRARHTSFGWNTSRNSASAHGIVAGFEAFVNWMLISAASRPRKASVGVSVAKYPGTRRATAHADGA